MNVYYGDTAQLALAAKCRARYGRNVDPRSELKDYLDGTLVVSTASFDILEWWKVSPIL
jgi:hypothetical protein